MKTSRIRFRKARRESGSVLVVCMVLAALGTIGVAAWFSLLDARSHQVEAGFKALERRVALRNSRALARRAINASLLHANNGLAADTIYEFPSGKGRATVRAYSGIPLKSDIVGSPARNGATPLSSHTTDVRVDLHDGNGTTGWIYRLRNQNPVLGGDLLSLHAPVLPTDSSSLVSGNLRVKGRAVFWDAIVRDLSNGLRADEYHLPNGIAGSTTFATTAGGATLPLNYPHYQRTTGMTSGGPAYRGELELLSATVNPQNAYESKVNVGVSIKLTGNSPKSESKGPASKPSSTEDATLLAFIDSNPPPVVADELSKNPSLSSGVLVAAINKANPAMTKNHYRQIFDAQTDIPDDALTSMMATLDDVDLDTALDIAITDLNVKNDAQFNATGKGLAQIFIDRPEISQIVVENITRLRLFGQPNAVKAAAAAALPPLLVIIDNRSGTLLGRIDLFHENRRPLILVVASSPSATAIATTTFKGSSAFPVWRTVFDLQNTGLAFDLSGVAGVRMLGGIRGHHRLSVAGGNLTLERDPDGAILAPLLSRDAWIESVRN